MDPVSLVASVITIVVTCQLVVQLLRYTVEALKEAPKALTNLLNQTQGLHVMLLRLDGLKNRWGEHSVELLESVFNEAQCLACIETLRKMVLEIAPSGGQRLSEAYSRLRWLAKKKDLNSITEAIQRHKQDLVLAVTLITAEFSAISEKEAQRQTEELLDQTAPHLAFPEPPPVYQERQDVQIWFGETLVQDPDWSPYYQKRYDLANAVTAGEWDRAFELLEQAKALYGQCWVNCIRFRISDQDRDPSGYTPLHQAALFGAPVEVVQKLVELGAWRTARSIRGGDNTPLDMVQTPEWDPLHRVLMPIIRHTVPSKTLDELQHRLHSLIFSEMRDDPKFHSRQMRLPDLYVLTELEVLAMWFPVDPSIRDRGFFFRLDDRELLVKSCNIHGKYSNRQYRISVEGCLPIHEAVIFDSSAMAYPIGA
ncbi:MAG: hypothetical protein M1835_005165 [Candelina submexicana]|nr:MAG: hypothetical protein M1835_005165 [Candelina submexicana]